MTQIFLSLDLIIGKDQSSIYMILDKTAVEIELIYNVWKVMNDVFQGSWPCKFQYKIDREDQAFKMADEIARNIPGFEVLKPCLMAQGSQHFNDIYCDIIDIKLWWLFNNDILHDLI